MKPLVMAAVLTVSIWAGVVFPAVALTVLAGLLTAAGIYDATRKATK